MKHLYCYTCILKSIKLIAEDLYLWLKQTQMKNLLLFGTLAIYLNSYGQIFPGSSYIDGTDTTICQGDSVPLNIFLGNNGINTQSIAFLQGQYATIPNNGFFISETHYTIEFWYKQTGFSGGDEHIFGIDYFDKEPYFAIGGNTLIQFLRGQSSVPYSPGGWTHIAGVRNGSNISFYINGILVLTEPYSSITPGTGSMTINHHTWASGSSARLSGFLDELRISDTVRYLSNFTPPAYEFVADANTIYLMHFNGDMIDVQGNSGNTNGTTWSNDTPFGSYSNTSFTWSTGDTSPNIYVQPTITTTYYAYFSEGGLNYSDSITIEVSNSQVTDIQSACDSYTWVDGNTYTTSNNSATYTTNNAAGCDSTVTLNLTITNSTSSTDIQSACDNYTWVDGNTYTTSNNSATYTTNNAAGCDSTVTLDLTITNSTSSTDIQTACDSYTWVDGNTYTTSNNSATYTTSNAVGCDSTVTLDLTINPTPDNSITQNGASLTATQTGATYQWIDCDNFNAPITGEVNQVFFPSSTGNYAVEVTIGDCSSTSECRLVDFTGIDEIESLISVHPNPTRDEVTLSIGAELLGTGFVVTDNAGRIILTDTFKSTKQTVNLSGFDNGVYFIRTDQESPVKIIKQ
jgi:hypothetical protein